MTDLIVEEQPNQTLAKAILILEAFDAEHPTWGIRELSRELKVNPATIYRLVLTLCNAGYLEQNPHTQRYSLGPSIMKLSRLYTSLNPLPAIATKVFERFADRFEYNFYLGMLSHRFDVIYLSVFYGRGPIQVLVEPGSTIKPHSTALGKLLLAYREDFVIQRILGPPSYGCFHTPHYYNQRRFLE